MNYKASVVFFMLLLLSSRSIAYATDHDFSKNSRLTKPKASPNIIIIVADQMRRTAMGFWQQEGYKNALNGQSDFVITPNLDIIASQGAVFTNAIANYPLCSPFRGMLLSGLFPHNNGVTHNTRTDRPEVGLRTDIITLTESLATAGYNTALVGKGHWQNNLPLFDDQNNYLGKTTAPGGHFFKGTRYDTYIPQGEARHGIEYWYQSLGHNHNNPVVYTNDTQLSGKLEGQPYYPKRYSAVDQANIIIDYIKNNRSQRDEKKPFSLLWTMDPPHSPYAAVDDTDEQIYNQFYKDIALSTLLNRANVDLKKAEKFARVYFSMVTLIDREIGRVMAALQQQGLEDNTLIVFTADHGEMMGSHSLMAKNTFYEESLGIPLIIHYPHKIPHHQNDLLISVPDFMPTILGLAGLTQFIPDNLDGNDFSDFILKSNNEKLNKPQASLYYGKDDELGVRTHQYTFVLNKDGKKIALFDNINDPYQVNMLSLNQLPHDEAQQLKKQLGFLLASIEHPWFEQRKYPAMILYP